MLFDLLSFVAKSVRLLTQSIKLLQATLQNDTMESEGPWNSYLQANQKWRHKRHINVSSINAMINYLEGKQKQIKA